MKSNNANSTIATESSVTGCGTAAAPACEPEAGSGVLSSAHGTSCSASWFSEAWVVSDSGTLSHLVVGKPPRGLAY